MDYKDYYNILGVSKGAGKDEIRSSFRKLARQYHPDVAGDNPKAEEKFKEINEAYEVLSDPEKRQKYDRLGANWKQSEGFRPPPGWQGGGSRGAQPDFDFNFGGTGFSDFFEQFFGEGRGHSPFGRGQGARRHARGADVQADILVTLEEVAHGSIRTISVQNRNGTGDVQTFKVKIPKGVSDGQKLRLAGKGEVGPGGSQAGDLFLRVRFAKHPDFRVEQGNLHFEASLAPWDAVLGSEIRVPFIGGGVQIRIPAGSQHGQKLRLKSKGLPIGSDRMGDLFVHLRVELPASLNEREKDLWQQLRNDSTFRPGNR